MIDTSAAIIAPQRAAHDVQTSGSCATFLVIGISRFIAAHNLLQMGFTGYINCNQGECETGLMHIARLHGLCWKKRAADT
jgi:hypothetical protein